MLAEINAPLTPENFDSPKKPFYIPKTPGKYELIYFINVYVSDKEEKITERITLQT